MATLIAVAAYVSVGRYYIGYVEKYQNELLDYVTEFTELSLNAKNITGRWSRLSPVLTLENLTLYSPDEKIAVLNIANISFQIDLFNSLVTRSPQVKRLQINGVECSLEEIKPGKWQLQGFANSTEQGVSQDLDKIINLLLSVDGIELTAAQIALHSYQDDRVSMLSLDEISLLHGQGFRRARLKATFENTDKPLLGIIESLGDPRDENFQASAYLKLDNIDFKSQLPAIKSLGFDLQDAQINSEIWLDWKPSREISIQGKIQTPHIDLAAISGESLQSINDFQLGFRAEKNSADEWEIWLPQIQAEWNEKNINLEKLFVAVKEEQIDISVSELELQKNLGVLGNQNILPTSIAEILDTLNPRGSLKNVHIRVARSVLRNNGASPKLSGKRLFHFKANLEQVELSPWKGAPGVVGLDGYLDVKPKNGYIELDTGPFAMSFPGLFGKPLDFSTVAGRLRWIIGDKAFSVRSGRLLFSAEHGPAAGILSLDIPLKKSLDVDPLMSLVVGLQDTDASYRDKFIPDTLPRNFLDWMKVSVSSGHIVNGGIVYRGSLRKGDVEDRTVQLFFDIDEAHVDYHPQWPAVEDFSGLVMVDDTDTAVTSTRATVEGLNILSSKIAASTVDGTLWLKVDAVASGQAQDALRLVNQSAIRTSVGDVFEDWKLIGNTAIDVSLGIPLTASELLPEININVQFSETELFIPDYNFKVSSMNGPLNYSSDDGVSSLGITGELYEKPLLVTVKQGQQKEVTVDLTGTVDMADVTDWSKQAALTFFPGETEFQAQVSVKPQSTSKLTVNSDLRGVKIELPEPYAKSEMVAIPFNLELPFADSKTNLSMTLDDQAELQIGFLQGQVQSGLLTFGKKKEGEFSESRHDKDFFVFNGEIDTIVFEEWQEVLERYLEADKGIRKAFKKGLNSGVKKGRENVHVEGHMNGVTLELDAANVLSKTSNGKTVVTKGLPSQDLKEGGLDKAERTQLENGSEEKPANKVLAENELAIEYPAAGLAVRFRNLRVGKIDGYARLFDNLVVNGERKRALSDDIESNLAGNNDGWFFSAQNRSFDASLFIPDDNPFYTSGASSAAGDPLAIHIKEIDLSTESGSGNEATSSIDPSSLNYLLADVVVDDILSDGESIGDLAFSISPMSNGIRFDSIRGSYHGVKIRRGDGNNLTWWKDEGGEHSHLVSSFHIENIGDVLENWNYERIIESESGSFGADLSWLGSPEKWELKSSAGTIDLNVSNGRFLNTSDAAEGTLRVVGLINLANVLSLQSSFSNLFDSGISFDKIKGSVNLEQERLSIIDNLIVESPSSGFQFRGDADMGKRLLDMELIVTLPVANNLPWIAALAGVGLPVAAGVYVVGKIFEKQVDRFSSGIYDISGDWDAPQLKFKRVFADAKQTKKKSEEENPPLKPTQELLKKNKAEKAIASGDSEKIIESASGDSMELTEPAEKEIDGEEKNSKAGKEPADGNDDSVFEENATEMEVRNGLGDSVVDKEESKDRIEKFLDEKAESGMADPAANSTDEQLGGDQPID